MNITIVAEGLEADELIRKLSSDDGSSKPSGSERTMNELARLFRTLANQSDLGDYLSRQRYCELANLLEACLRGNRGKIAAIKALREISGKSLRETKDIIETLSIFPPCCEMQKQHYHDECDDDCKKV